MEQRVPQQSLFSAAFINPTEEWNMKERLLVTTAIGLMLGTGAFAQSPNDKSKTEPPPRRKARPIKILPRRRPPRRPLLRIRRRLPRTRHRPLPINLRPPRAN